MSDPDLRARLAAAEESARHWQQQAEWWRRFAADERQRAFVGARELAAARGVLALWRETVGSN